MRQVAAPKPRIMGVLNCTPDSFSDGGHFTDLDKALVQVERMVAEGADIIDVGGESTRPGAQSVSLDEEASRVLPVLERVIERFSVEISVDTSTPEIMSRAIELGVSMVNDVRAFETRGALTAIRGARVALCVMHMQGDPARMQNNPTYADPVDDVLAYLKNRVEVLLAEGFERNQIFVDPGFGFGKTLEDNLALLANLSRFRETGCEVLAGLSRKRMIGELTGRPVDERDAGSAAAAAFAVAQGAAIIRTHNVAVTKDAVAIAHALAGQSRCQK